MMHLPETVTAVSMLVLGGALLLPQGGRGADAPRVERVINNLQVIDFSVPQQTGESATLTARMEVYKTPGVSMAVINDGAIEWARRFGVLKAGDSACVSEQSILCAVELGHRQPGTWEVGSREKKASPMSTTTLRPLHSRLPSALLVICICLLPASTLSAAQTGVEQDRQLSERLDHSVRDLVGVGARLFR